MEVSKTTKKGLTIMQKTRFLIILVWMDITMANNASRILIKETTITFFRVHTPCEHDLI